MCSCVPIQNGKWSYISMHFSSLLTPQSALQDLPHSPIHTHINTVKTFTILIWGSLHWEDFCNWGSGVQYYGHLTAGDSTSLSPSLKMPSRGWHHWRGKIKLNSTWILVTKTEGPCNSGSYITVNKIIIILFWHQFEKIDCAYFNLQNPGRNWVW